MYCRRIAETSIIAGLVAGSAFAFSVPALAAPASSSLSVSVMAQPARSAVGQPITVSVTVRNAGSHATNVDLIISTLANLTYVSSNGCAQVSNEVQCSLNSVPMGATKTVTIQLRAA